MTPEVQLRDAVITNLTLSLLEDSGWYKVNWSLAEPHYWGYHQGCNFPIKLCNASENFSEFCQYSYGCTKTGVFKGQCSASYFSDGCYFISPFAEVLSNCRYKIEGNEYQDEKKAEIFGENSKCFYSSIYEIQSLKEYLPTCYETYCQNGQLIIIVNNNNFTCYQEGQILQIISGNYVGSIVCPNIEEYCMDDFQICGSFCSTYGYCINGECLCIDGHEGETCDGWFCIDNCEKCSDAITCSQCNSQFYLNEDATQCVKQCSDNKWFDQELQLCLECVEFCVVCSGGNQCSECIAGRSPSSDSLSCNCNNGTYSTENKECALCADAISNCIICSSNTICEQCEEEYELTENYMCQKIQNETEDNQTEDNQTEDNQTEDNQTEDNQTEDNQTEDNQTEDNQTEDNQTEDNQTEDNQTEDNQTEDNQTEDNQTEDNQTEDNQTEDNQTEDNQTEDNQTEDNQTEDNQTEDNQTEDNQTEDNQTEDNQTEETNNYHSTDNNNENNSQKKLIELTFIIVFILIF